MGSQVNSATAANAEADGTLLSPVSPLSISSSSHEAHDNYSPVTLDDPDLQQPVSAGQVLLNPLAPTNVAHGFVHPVPAIREALPEASPTEDQTVRLQPSHNLSDPDETNAMVQGAG
jgi:hypothetical protein